METDARRRLDAELRSIFSRGVDLSLKGRRFDALARETFAVQFESNRPYRSFCEGRGRTPETVERWEEIPAVPTDAFKVATLVSGSVEGCDATFRTSGTTRGPEGRGAHVVRDLSFYRAAALPPFRRHLLPVEAFPDGRCPIFSLTPSAEDLEDSSLSTMIAFAIDAFGAEGSGFFGRVEGELEIEALMRGLNDAVSTGPALLVGTAFAWVQWLDRTQVRATPTLPEGSVVMETGGFKGRSRVVARTALYSAISDRLGVPVSRIVNEYGMTEMLSQFYEPVLSPDPDRSPTGDLDRRWLRSPPWVRTRVLDPITLSPLKPGQSGLLAHFDLANLHSVSSILTSDLGVMNEEGDLRVLGRPTDAEARGCSLTMEEFMERSVDFETVSRP